jgi:hypothetical protein
VAQGILAWRGIARHRDSIKQSSGQGLKQTLVEEVVTSRTGQNPWS